MFKKNLAMILGLGLAAGASLTTPQVEVNGMNRERITSMCKSKGQIRSAKPKASGAAQLKRDAKKRKNKR